MRMKNGKSLTENLWPLSKFGKAPWWPKTRSGDALIHCGLGPLQLKLPNFPVDIGSHSYYADMADDLVEASLRRWLLKHEYCFDWDIQQEAWVSITHGLDVFGNDLVELMKYIQKENL